MRTLSNERFKKLRNMGEWALILAVVPTLFIVCNARHVEFQKDANYLTSELMSESQEDYSLSHSEIEDRYLHMTVSLIKKAEGFKSTWYTCPSGKRTIGYGFTNIEWSGKMSKKEADSILVDRYLFTRENVIKLVKHSAVQESHIAALTSFTYNVGLQALKESKLLKYINSGKIHLAKGEFKKWIYIKSNGSKQPLKGLIHRRTKEVNLWDRELS